MKIPLFLLLSVINNYYLVNHFAIFFERLNLQKVFKKLSTCCSEQKNLLNLQLSTLSCLGRGNLRIRITSKYYMKLGEVMELKENERIDDLQCKGLKIIQNKKEFCFGIDAVLLSDFAKKTKKNAKIIDLCTGTGIIAILLTAKAKASKIIGVEIQEHIAEMATRSVRLNHLDEKVEIINEDLMELKRIIPAGTIDTVTVNPPYKPKNSGIINEKDSKTIARHEISCTLEDIIKESARLLNTGGNLCLVHKVERMTDIFVLLRKYKLEPKRMRLVYSKVGEPATLILIEGVKGGKPFLKLETPIYVYEKNNQYTNQVKEIYGMNDK